MPQLTPGSKTCSSTEVFYEIAVHLQQRRDPRRFGLRSLLRRNPSRRQDRRRGVPGSALSADLLRRQGRPDPAPVRRDRGRRRVQRLPGPFRKIHRAFHDRWEALSPDEARLALSRMAMLRNIPFFYLRNFAINMAQKTIRLQFNCDGTHIVSAEDYGRFVEENLES